MWQGIITFDDGDDIPVKPASVFYPSGVVHAVVTTRFDRLLLILAKGPGVTAKTTRHFMNGNKTLLILILLRKVSSGILFNTLCISYGCIHE